MEALIGKCMNIRDDLQKCGYNSYVPIKMWDLVSIIDKRTGFTEHTTATINAIKHTITLMLYTEMLVYGGDNVYWLGE